MKFRKRKSTMGLGLLSISAAIFLFFSADAFAQTAAAPTASAAPAKKASAPAAGAAPSTAPAVVPGGKLSSTLSSPPVPVTAPSGPTTSAALKTEAKSAATVPASVAVVGGGEGKVWVNTKSNVYHCPGSKYFGKTGAGQYMTEADAKAKGGHADHDKACAK